MTRYVFAFIFMGLIVTPRLVTAQDLSLYRSFHLKSSVASVSEVVGLQSPPTTLHQQPALLQDLQWRPSRWVENSALPSTDPVDRIDFSFYNDQLFRIVVAYRRDGTNGLTDADIIEAIGETYGARATPLLQAGHTPSNLEKDAGRLLARWAGVTERLALYREPSYSGTPGAVQLMLTDVDLVRLADKATIEARRREDLDAPRQAAAKEKADQEAERAEAEKARRVNKSVFQP